MAMKLHSNEIHAYMKWMSLAVAALLMLFMTAVPAVRADTASDDKKLDAQIAAFDKDAGSPKGEQIVTERLEKEFNATEAQIQSLRNEKLGFGEIAIVLSLASNLPGGLTDANITKITSMREGPPVQGWGEIAKSQGVKLGSVLSKVEKIEKTSHNEIMKDEKIEHEKSGMGAGGVEEEHERMEREMPEHSHGRY
jgi:hypothetical protein